MSTLERPEVYITNTYLANLQAAASRRGRNYPYLPNTTLNELLEYSVDDMPHGTIPQLHYWSIGFDGTVIKDFNGRQTPVATWHNIEHVGLYGMIPFARRRKDNDLPPERRVHYAGRVESTDSDGVEWVTYWLKRIPKPTEELGLKKITKVNGNTEEDVYFPQSSNLRPPKPLLQPDGVNEVFTEFIATTDMIVCELNREEIEEVIEAVRLLYGHSELAAITEIGLVQGVDKTISATNHRGEPFSFNECVGAQIATICCKANGSLLGEDVFRMAFDVAVSDAMAIG